jgi:hypothetical protein
MNFGSVKEQKTKGDMLHHPKRAMGLRRFLQPAMRRLGAHRCTLNAGQFALGLGPAKRNMHDQLHRRPYRFPQDVIMRRDRKSFHQLEKGTPCLSIYQLRRAIGNFPQGTSQAAELTLMSVATILPRILFSQVLDFFFFQGLQGNGQNGYLDLRSSLFEALDQPN